MTSDDWEQATRLAETARHASAELAQRLAGSTRTPFSLVASLAAEVRIVLSRIDRVYGVLAMRPKGARTTEQASVASVARSAPNELERWAEDDEPWVLPAHGLYADVDLGVGVVHLESDILDLPAVRRVKIIDGWIAALTEERGRAAAEGHPALSRVTPSDDVEKTARRDQGEAADPPGESTE